MYVNLFFDGELLTFKTGPPCIVLITYVTLYTLNRQIMITVSIRAFKLIFLNNKLFLGSLAFL